MNLYEAMNAVQIAKYAKADQFGGDTYQNAVKLLQQAEDYKNRKQFNPSIMTAKEAVQKAEDSRIIALRKEQQMALDQERADAAARQAASQAEAEEQARQARSRGTVSPKAIAAEEQGVNMPAQRSGSLPAPRPMPLGPSRRGSAEGPSRRRRS